MFRSFGCRVSLWGAAILTQYVQTGLAAAAPARKTGAVKTGAVKTGAVLPAANIDTRPTSLPEVAFPDFRNVLDKRMALEKRADMKYTTVYAQGNATAARTAQQGFDMRVDPTNSVYVWCLASATQMEYCGQRFGHCVDSRRCKNGCGITSNPNLATMKCDAAFDCEETFLMLDDNKPYYNVMCATSQAAPQTFWPDAAAAVRAAIATSGITTGANTPPLTPTTIPSIPEASGKTNNGMANVGNGKSDTGIIVGAALGGLGLLCVTGLVALVIRRRKGGRGQKSEKDTQGQEMDPPSVDEQAKKYGGWAPQELGGSRPRVELGGSDARGELPGSMPTRELVELPDAPADYRRYSSGDENR